MENININAEIEKDLSSDEDTELDLIETDAVEINPLDTKDNDYLLAGIFGNGSAFLKASLYHEMKSNNKSFKIKFMSRYAKDRTKAKKVCAEIYQFSTNDTSNLVIHTKGNLSEQSYKYIVDYLSSNGITYKRVAVFDSAHTSRLFGDVQDGVYCLKNSIQIQSNQFIPSQPLPSPNTIQGFSAYLLTYFEVNRVPTVVYIGASNLYEVCLGSMACFDKTAVSYAFLRKKLTSEYMNSKNITGTTMQMILREYNSSRSMVYI